MNLSLSRPSVLLFLSEPSRALVEMGLSYQFTNSKQTVKSDGHPVIVLPGFMGSEKSTIVLRNFIKKLGYDVYDWGLGRNVGKIEYLELLLERVDEIHAKTGKAISLVGWSLGGVFARQVAKSRPDIIRQLITLGSPFAGLAEPNNAEWLFTLVSGGKKIKEVDATFLSDLPLKAPVPSTAIYTKEDGVVAWKMCMEQTEDALHQNIQVRGSHIGLGFNASVLSIIEDRLKLKKSTWEKFKPSNSITKRLFYPSL